MKSNYLLSMLLIIVGSMTCLSSCGNDDEEGGENNPASGGNTTDGKAIAGALNGGLGISDKPGYRIASADGYQFGYDTEGNLTSIKYDGTELIQSKDPLTITYSDESNKVYFNKEGYVSKIIWREGEVGEEPYDGTFTYSYDSNRQLKECVIKLSGTDDGEPWTEDYNMSLTYKSGNLTSATNKWSYTEVDEGEKDSGSGIERAVFSYDNAGDNSCRQYTGTTVDVITSYFAEFTEVSLPPLFFLGLMGKGSVQLPTSINVSWEDFEDEWDTGGRIFDLSYAFNAEGAIGKETSKVTRINNGKTDGTYYSSYSYSYRWSNGTRASTGDGEIRPKESSPKHHRFRHHSHRR